MASASAKPKFASQQDPFIAAAVGGYYRFEALKDALVAMNCIRSWFIQSKDAPGPREDGTPQLKLWVAGFETTAAEKAQGFRGNFARLWVEFLPAGYYTIKAEKLDVPLSRHPQKDRPKGAHPNRGNPVMRAVEKGKIFPGIAEANALLHQLHVDYPSSTMPGMNCLHITLYDRKASGPAPVEKIVIKVQPLAEGGARLVMQQKRAKPKPLPVAATAPREVAGKFTQMVQKKRSRRP